MQSLPENHLSLVIQEITPIQNIETLCELIKVLGNDSAIKCLVTHHLEIIENLLKDSNNFQLLFIYLSLPLATILLSHLNNWTAIIQNSKQLINVLWHLTMSAHQIVFDASITIKRTG